jgi:hypothetical protein
MKASFRSGYGARADRVIMDVLDDVRRAPRYQDKSVWIETSSTGEGWLKKRGGIWNDTSGRASLGTTKRDVQDCARLLRGVTGRKFTFEEADALLTEAYFSTKGASHEALLKAKDADLEVKEYHRTKMQRIREARRAAGTCVQCGGKRGTPNPGKATCTPCCAAINASKKRSAG